MEKELSAAAPTLPHRDGDRARPTRRRSNRAATSSKVAEQGLLTLLADQLLTRREVARILRVSERTVLALTNRGDLPCVKLGRGENAKRLYLNQDVCSFIEVRREEASSRRIVEARSRPRATTA